MFQSYLEQPLLVALNVAPVIWATLLLWAVTGRVWLSVLISGAVTMILTLINAVKLALRDTPFLWEDLALAGEAGDMAGKYQIVLTDGEWSAIGMVIVLTLICAVLARRRPTGWRRKGAWKRLICLAALIAAGALGWNEVYQSAAIYQDTANNDLINIWNDTEVFQSRGFLYPFLYSAKAAKDDPPEGYSAQAAQDILAEYENQDIPEEERVNVMGIMLEAYTDLTDYEQLSFAEPAYEAFHTLEEESWSGTLITNIFAGGTIDTERAFVTGFANPGSYRAATNSYAWYFWGQGYTVEGSHPGYSWFYNRTNVNANLGFERYLFSEGYYEDMIDPVAAPYHSDSVFLDHLADLLEEGIAEDKPYFSFSVTYQNHGPYEAASTTWEDYMPQDCAWSESTQNILNNYLDGVRRTGEYLMALTERLEAMEEPVVLVAFGDHKPWLGDSNSVYQEVGINLGLGEPEGFQNYYSTPYFIWANSAAKEVLGQEFVGEGPTISPCFLMCELFDQCGWEGNAFMQLSREVKALVPVITESGRYLDTGVSFADLTEAQQEAVTRYDLVQYYWRKDAPVAELPE